MFVEKVYNLIHKTYSENPNRGIPERWLAGFFSVENAQLKLNASRFEPHVYADIERVYKGGKAQSFPGFNSGLLGNYIRSCHFEGHRRALATSWGLGQIMGYHYLNKFNIRPEVLPNMPLQNQLHYMLRMLSDGMRYVQKGRDPYEQLLRWWNTGSTSGTTHHPDYVANAKRWSESYGKYLNSRGEAQ